MEDGSERVGRGPFFEKETFTYRPAGRETASLASNFGKNIGNGQCKGPEVGM